jgi:hypothetical protein
MAEHGRERLVQLWEPTEHQGYRLGVSVSHGADGGETITGVGHVEVGKQYVKVFCGDAAEGFSHARYRDHLESVAFERCLKHIANSVVVLCQ